MGKYDDMIHLDRPASRHPGMRRGDRAKLFAPFDALSGFSDSVKEKDRVYLPRTTPTDYVQEGIDRRLRALRRQDPVTVIYFVSLRRTAEEDLGEYRAAAGVVSRVDEIEQKLVLDRLTIPFADIVSLTGGGPENTEAACADRGCITR